MDNPNLWSLRLGFSGRQAETIRKNGINIFLKDSFLQQADSQLPAFLKDQPKTPVEVKAFRDNIKKGGDNTKILEGVVKTSYDLKAWWLEKMRTDSYPLREKMVLFWHNHYVSTIQKVRVNYWIYNHNQILRENAFGNFREITKKILKTNAMVVYLDNTENKRDNLNENLSRELLELFTLGVGNYNESDVKNGSKALAGLSIGADGPQYSQKKRVIEPFTFMGKTGKFDVDDIVDIIFQQKNAPYFITRKLLKWFIYDNPPENLVAYYGDYLREQNYEIEPLLTKIITEEFDKKTAGSKIKDPLVYLFQLLNELGMQNPNNKLVGLYLRNQGMDLFNQPNVKGWDGGKSWITAYLFLLRNNLVDQLCKGKNFSRKPLKSINADNEVVSETFNAQLSWRKKGTNKDVIAEFKNRLLFNVDDDMQKDFENILKYDFDPEGASAANGVMRLFNFMVKTPEFQII